MCVSDGPLWRPLDQKTNIAERLTTTTSSSEMFLDKDALVVSNILLEKSVPDLLDNPVTTLYDSRPYRSSFVLKDGTMDYAVVMILKLFYVMM